MNAPPSPPLQVVPAVPNTVFSQRMRDTRSQSTSPRLRRVISPSLSIAQMCAQTAEWKADTAISSVRRIVDQAFRARSTANDAIAEVCSVCKQVESRIVDIL